MDQDDQRLSPSPLPSPLDLPHHQHGIDPAAHQQHLLNSSDAGAAGAKRSRPAPAKTFQCRGFGECRMVFSRSEHLARHVRKHTGERPFSCHCGKQFSRLDNLRQHAQTVHSDKHAENEIMMRELTSLHTQLAAKTSKGNRDVYNPGDKRRGTASGEAGSSMSEGTGGPGNSPTYEHQGGGSYAPGPLVPPGLAYHQVAGYPPPHHPAYPALPPGGQYAIQTPDGYHPGYYPPPGGPGQAQPYPSYPPSFGHPPGPMYHSGSVAYSPYPQVQYPPPSPGAPGAHPYQPTRGPASPFLAPNLPPPPPHTTPSNNNSNSISTNNTKKDQASHFLDPQDQQSPEDPHSTLGLPPRTIPPQHAPPPTPMDTSHPQDHPIPFGTNNHTHLYPSLPSPSIQAPMAARTEMSSLGALIPMQEEQQQQQREDRGLMGQISRAPSITAMDTTVNNSNSNSNPSANRGLTMDQMQMMSPARSSRVFGSGGRGGSRGIGTPTPPPAIITSQMQDEEQLRQQLLLRGEDQGQGQGQQGIEQGWGLAVGLPPTPVSATTAETRGLRQTTKRRSPPDALVLGMGMPSRQASPMQGKQQPMKLGIRAASAFTPRVASPLSAWGVGSAGSSARDSPNSSSTTNSNQLTTPITPGNLPISFQQQGARRDLFLRSLPSSPVTLPQSANATISTNTNAFHQNNSTGMYPPTTTHITPPAGTNLSPRLSLPTALQSTADLEQRQPHTSSMHLHHPGAATGPYYHQEAVHDLEEAAAAERNDWDLIQAILEGREGLHQPQPQASGQPAVGLGSSAAPEHLQGTLDFPPQRFLLRHRSSEEESSHPSSSSASAASSTSTPVLQASLPSHSTHPMFPTNTSLAIETGGNTSAISISTGLPLEGLSLASAASVGRPSLPSAAEHQHPAGAFTADDRTRLQDHLGWGPAAMEEGHTMVDMEYDRGQQLQQQTPLRTPSQEGLNDLTRRTLVTEAASRVDGTHRSSTREASAGLTTGQQLQSSMMMPDPLAGGFPLWNSAPLQPPPLVDQRQQEEEEFRSAQSATVSPGQAHTMTGPDGLARLLSKSQTMTQETANHHQPSQHSTLVARTQTSLQAARRPPLRPAMSTGGLKARASRPTFIALPTQSFASLNLPPAPLTSPGAAAIRTTSGPQLSPLARNAFKMSMGPWTGPGLGALGNPSPMTSPTTQLTPRRNSNFPTPNQQSGQSQMEPQGYFSFEAPTTTSRMSASSRLGSSSAGLPPDHNPYFPSVADQEMPLLQPAHHQQHQGAEFDMGMGHHHSGSQNQTPTMQQLMLTQRQNAAAQQAQVGAAASQGFLPHMPPPQELPHHLYQGLPEQGALQGGGRTT